MGARNIGKTWLSPAVGTATFLLLVVIAFLPTKAVPLPTCEGGQPYDPNTQYCCGTVATPKDVPCGCGIQPTTP
jgi:hypothetical protein